jgi:3-methyladenine DNA glycosylase AlkC
VAEPFKNLISKHTIAAAAQALAAAWPTFDRAGFSRVAGAGLDTLELKPRAMQIAAALEQYLPADFSQACGIIEASLAAPTEIDDSGEPIGVAAGGVSNNGLRGWIVWSLGEFVARRGQGELARAMKCLHALTQRFSAEFAIRYFLQAAPRETLKILQGWVTDPSVHVRRLVSEGTRSRLPWGIRLQVFVDDPRPTLALIERLQDDSSAYVRRSVANHLNDVAKDHPDLVVAWLRQHLPKAPAPRVALLRHASRTLVKQGHPPTLQAWGVGQALKGTVTLAVTPKRVCIGGALALRLEVHSSTKTAQQLVIDYAVHHQRANGGTSAKVFKGWKLTLAPQQTVSLKKSHSLKVVTTRKLYPGAHRLDVRVNGKVVAEAAFALLPAAT